MQKNTSPREPVAFAKVTHNVKLNRILAVKTVENIVAISPTVKYVCLKTILYDNLTYVTATDYYYDTSSWTVLYT